MIYDKSNTSVHLYVCVCVGGGGLMGGCFLTWLLYKCKWLKHFSCFFCSLSVW